VTRRVSALSHRQIAAADAETGQVAFVRSVPSFCPRHSLAVERRFVVSAGVLFRRQFALAPQFREAGVDRRKIIGSTGSGHVSSDRFCRSSADATGSLKGGACLPSPPRLRKRKSRVARAATAMAGSPMSVLEILATQPGPQSYGGNNLDGSAPGPRRALSPIGGFAFEPRGFPNQPNFPSTILRPGQVYPDGTRRLYQVDMRDSRSVSPVARWILGRNARTANTNAGTTLRQVGFDKSI
jgi:hypothetical protein